MRYFGHAAGLDHGSIGLLGQTVILGEGKKGGRENGLCFSHGKQRSD